MRYMQYKIVTFCDMCDFKPKRRCQGKIYKSVQVCLAFLLHLGGHVGHRELCFVNVGYRLFINFSITPSLDKISIEVPRNIQKNSVN
jgi:hypothetical protein